MDSVMEDNKNLRWKVLCGGLLGTMGTIVGGLEGGGSEMDRGE